MVYGHQLRFTVGGAVHHLALIASVMMPADIDFVISSGVAKTPAISSSGGPLVAASFQRADSDKMESCRHNEEKIRTR